ncbi:hypothetical protein PoB_004206900 [Plakobranchus ocellatus]|uniref:Uncharacterized protein n=1 Tax=Plakobranchus ocellatus TaxID=259542 RepID=A0AAV4BA29_9GAST|nr:hypothetical protein PoB_004206900 [Plakobranchus ocellatus]
MSPITLRRSWITGNPLSLIVQQCDTAVDDGDADADDGDGDAAADERRLKSLFTVRAFKFAAAFAAQVCTRVISSALSISADAELFNEVSVSSMVQHIRVFPL